MRGWFSWAASVEDTLSLREDMVESGTGHLPIEFWSSFESRVGFQELVCSRKCDEGRGTHTGKAACSRM